ncbi:MULTISPECIES: hypothetical protein [Streptomyces]|uniref:hypothetical protein n=1 Tax=Streptomyces TaxID=1883 RepID=UPI000241B7B6|nr:MULTISPECIES: hypothetical protein [Streptomyces]EHM28124.1 hypothetical protein SPW_3473 [Streptomyces sp. W007]WSI78217.1 hypothetical protein OG557_15240 [Streptomyces anulatus]WSU74215.1 hypothetical protein OG499_15210 [Streptomyces anulatus]WTD10476.1 hypothetical protein OHA54_15035 [Streptomyces anulatus]WTD27431.1 hypothetical protein OH737_24225 [Streptomyces anulatus]
MKAAAFFKDTLTGPGAATRAIGAALLLTTLAAQHPHPAFERGRNKDLFSLVPNWKFFAPNPATHDYHYLYRTLDENRETSPWVELDLIENRRMIQAIWFSSRRTEKAVFDICSAIIKNIAKGEDPTGSPSFRVLAEFIRKQIRDAQDVSAARGFQFSVVRASGHDDSEDPEVLYVSTYQPMVAAAPGFLKAA